MISATIVRESPFSRQWRTNGNLRYEVAMNCIIIILNIAATLYMSIRTHKIPVADLALEPVIYFTGFYITAIVGSCCFWVMAVDDESFYGYYLSGRIGHFFGFCLFLCLLYSISHHLALYFCLPLLWFVPAMIEPCCPCLWRGEQACLNFVKQPQPQSTVDIV